MFGYKIIKEKQFDNMNYLINCLRSFIFVAKTDGSRSKAVEHIDIDIKSYDKKWGEK